MDKPKIKYEIVGGELKTPLEGEIIIPPENTARKDIEEGEFRIITEPTSKEVEAFVEDAKRKGITDIPNPEEKLGENGR